MLFKYEASLLIFFFFSGCWMGVWFWLISQVLTFSPPRGKKSPSIILFTMSKRFAPIVTFFFFISLKLNYFIQKKLRFFFYFIAALFCLILDKETSIKKKNLKNPETREAAAKLNYPITFISEGVSSPVWTLSQEFPKILKCIKTEGFFLQYVWVSMCLSVLRSVKLICVSVNVVNLCVNPFPICAGSAAALLQGCWCRARLCVCVWACVRKGGQPGQAWHHL